MIQELRIKPSLVSIERKDGYYIGHLNDQIVFPNLELRLLLRNLNVWHSLQEISRWYEDESCANQVKKALEQLDRKGFLQWRNKPLKARKVLISHMNEIGLALVPILYEEGMEVSTLDNRSVALSQIRAGFLRVGNHGENFQEILSSQIREMINSGKSKTKSIQQDATLSPRVVEAKLESDELSDELSDARDEMFALITTYPEPELLSYLMQRQIPHLFLTVTPSGANIGPMVRPGESPCFHCIELHRSDVDGQWQSVALTLFCRRLEPLPMAQAHLVTALAAEKISALFQEKFTSKQFAEISTFEFPTFGIARPVINRELEHMWSFHPGCSCHWAGAFASGGPALSTRGG